MRPIAQHFRNHQRKKVDQLRTPRYSPRHLGGYVLCCALGMALSALSHDSPEHRIQDLSFQIIHAGTSPALLMERAGEHRAAGELDFAAADFEAAFKLDPTLVQALKELSLVQLAQGKIDPALQTINRALALVGRDSVEPSSDLLIARAEIHTARQDFRAALQDCNAAFAKAGCDLESYLLRAQIQRRLGLFKDCLNGLRDGFAKTGSAVLHEEAIDAMIDAGQCKAALKRIEPELANSRWRSSWLIRRARARLGLGQTKSARRDLQHALAELDQRIVLAAPDITLIINRGMAHALLGQQRLGQMDLQFARSLSADAGMLWRLENLVSQ